MVSSARDTLRRGKVGQATRVIQGVAQHPLFSDTAFDTVVSTFPSEYIYDLDTVAEVERVLRPGGRLVVIEGANLLPVGLLQPFLLVIQLLVYGPSAVFGPRKQHNLDEEMAHNRGEGLPDKVLHTNRDTGTGVTTDILPDAERERGQKRTGKVT